MSNFRPGAVSNFLTLFVSLVLASALSAQQEATAQPGYLNPALPLEQRVNDLIGRMTLEEKVSQMRDHARAHPAAGRSEVRLVERGPAWCRLCRLRDQFPSGDRDGGHLGHRPCPRKWARLISTEARAKYNDAMRNDQHEMFFGLTFWAPNINIFRDPRWGRGQETYGEDPFLTSRMGVAFVTGMQGRRSRLISGWSQLRSTMPCTAARSCCGTALTWMSRRTILRTLICPPFALR